MHSIALVVNSFPKLSETFIYNKVKFLSDNGFSVSIITHSKGDRGGVPPSVGANVDVVLSPISFSKINCLFRLFYNSLVSPYEIWSAYKFLKKNRFSFSQIVKSLILYLPFIRKYDIIHFAFSGVAIVYLPLIPHLKNSSLIYVSCRGSAELISPLISDGRKRKLKTLFSVIDRVHCVSNNMLSVCEKMGLDPNKAFLNRPAIDASMFQKRLKYKQNSICIVSVGRLHWVKAIETLLMALRQLVDENINVVLYLVGDGLEKEKLIFLSHLLNIEKNVVFVGAQAPSRIVEILSKADIYAHSSISEGISNSVMEAMAMELPVVSTDVGGMSELIDDQVDGFLVPPLDATAMANKLSILCHDANLRLQIGRNARLKILKDFTLGRQRNEYLDEYTRALASKI